MPLNIKILQFKFGENIKNGSLFAIFSFLNSAIGFLITLILAKYILLKSYGLLSLYTTLVSWLSIIICLNTNGLLAIYFFSSNKRSIAQRLNVIFITSFCVYIFITGISISLPSYIQDIIGLNTKYIILAVTVCFLQTILNCTLDIWRLEEKIGRYGLFAISIVLSNLILTFCFVGIMHFDWEGRIYAQLLTCIIFAIIGFLVLLHKGYVYLELPPKTYFKEGLSFGLPLIPHSMSFWFRQGLDRYIINFFLGHTAVAIFSFAYNFANIIQIIGFAFNASNSVYVYKTLSNITIDSKTKLRKNSRLLIVIYIILTTIIYIGATIFIPIFFPKYTNSIPLLFPLCIGAMFQCFYLVYVNIIFFFKKNKILMYITTTLSILHCLISILVTQFGVQYTSYIPIISNGMIFILVYLYAQKLLDKITTN